jgi:type IV fimbrial biogenesis protein FimT
VSLIEVSVTLALAALMLFAVVPEVSSMVANHRVRGNVESVQQGLQRARNEALRRNQEVSFWLVTANASGNLDNSCALSASGSAWVVSRNDPSGKCAAASSEITDPLLIEKSVGGSGAGVALAALQTDGATAANRVVFDGFGRVASADAIARIDLDNASSGNDFRPLRLQVTRGGGVRLCEPRVSATGDPRRC